MELGSLGYYYYCYSFIIIVILTIILASTMTLTLTIALITTTNNNNATTTVRICWVLVPWKMATNSCLDDRTLPEISPMDNKPAQEYSSPYVPVKNRG